MRALFFICAIFSLNAKEGEFSFKGLENKPLELLSIFLSDAPKILSLPPFPGEERTFLQKWPNAVHSSNNDFLRLRLDEFEPFAWLTPEYLSSTKALLIESFVFPFFDDSFVFREIKEHLIQAGFFPLAHRYIEGVQAELIFLKQDLLYSPTIASYLSTHHIDSSYHYYQQLYFHTCYCLDDDPNDSVKQVLMTGHPYEGTLSLMLQAIAKPGTLAIDIGAHVGVHTIFLSRKVGNSGAVISFEPNKKLYMEHLYNLDFNHCENVIPICKGLGESAKKEMLHRITIEQEDILEGEAQEIEIIPLDSLNLMNVSVIKMDVENYEYFVLKGAKNTLLKNKPALLFECWIGYEYDKKNGAHQRENFERVMDLLDSYCYEIYIIYNCDFLAIPRAATDETLLSYKAKLKKLDPKTYQPALDITDNP
jgi:FkbM family methyltransferase